MLRPRRMCKIEILGSREYLNDVIDTLYAKRLLHIHDYSEEEISDLKLGKPLPQSPEISDKLNKLHRINTSLDTKDIKTKKRFKPSDIMDSLDRKLLPSEEEIIQIMETKRTYEEKRKRTKAKKEVMENLLGLPLSLDDLSGYKSLTCFVGYTSPDIEKHLSKELKDYQLYSR